MFDEKPTLYEKLLFFLTCWRPISKYEFARLQSQLVIILEGLRDSDLSHYQIERMLETELRRVVEKEKIITDENIKEKKEDKMFG